MNHVMKARFAPVLSALLLAGTVAFAQSGSSVSETLAVRETIGAISRATYETREQLLNDLDSRLEAAGKAIDALEREGAAFKGEAASEFKQALDDTRSAQRDLGQGIAAARSAGAEQWENARTLVAGNYNTFVRVVAKLELAAARGR